MRSIVALLKHYSGFFEKSIIMTDLISQLTQLQQQLTTLRQNYLAVNDELTKIKNSPTISVEEHNEFKRQLILANEKNAAIMQNLAQEQARYQALEQRYQSLADSHSILGEQNDTLTQQLEQTSQLANTLAEKNRIATEHTKLVQERLTMIDTENMAD